MADGPRTTDLPLVTAADELVVNQTIDGIKRTVRVSRNSLAAQMVASGPIREEIAAVDAKITAAATTYNVTVSTAAALPSVGYTDGATARVLDTARIYVRASGAWVNTGPLPEANDVSSLKATPSAVAEGTVDDKLVTPLGISPVTFAVRFYETLDLPDAYGFDLVDAAGNIQWQVRDNLQSEFYETLEGGGFALVDIDGNIQLQIDVDAIEDGEAAHDEVVAARGSRASLAERLDQSISAYGVPRRHLWGEWRLRRTRAFLEGLRQGKALQFDLGIIGDSWSHVTTRWTGPVAQRLMTAYGDGGAGWMGFGYFTGTGKNGNVRDSIYTMTRTGTWADVYQTSVSPDACHATSSEAGAKYSMAGAATPVLSAADLFFVGTADGIVRYRWNGGGWTSVNVQGVVGDLQTAGLTGLPASGAWTLEIEVVSGAVALAGLNFKSAANGVRVHKLAASGSQAAQWAAIDAVQWQGGITELNLQAVIVVLGTNDRSSNRTPAQFAANIATIAQRIRVAADVADVPAPDILLVLPYQSTEAKTYSIAQYVDACRAVAEAENCAILDLQAIIGEPGSYDAWLNNPLTDGRHPDLTYGSPLIADAIWRALIN